MIMWLPAESEDVLYVACPVPSRVTGEPSVIAPSLNVTVPFGVPDPGALVVTVAANVTVWLKYDGFRDDVTEVEVAALLTV